MEITETELSRVHLIKPTGGLKRRIITTVDSKSRRELSHVVYVDLATGRAEHATGECQCRAALAGRKCWHTAAALEFAKNYGYHLGPRLPSVFDTKLPIDKQEEI